MVHDETYFQFRMMDALDGELAENDRLELEAHLRACPECVQEWQALVAVDTLFRQAPMLRPAADFAQRTIARLPNRRARVWALSSIYVLLMLAGIFPVLAGGWLLTRYAPIFSEPAVMQRVWDSVAGTGQVLATILGALLSGAGRLVVEQPSIVGWLLLLAGVVFLWGGFAQRLVLQPRRQLSRN